MINNIAHILQMTKKKTSNLILMQKKIILQKWQSTLRDVVILLYKEEAVAKLKRFLFIMYIIVYKKHVIANYLLY